MSVNPQDMFKTQSDLYSQFDADGIPTHDADGNQSLFYCVYVQFLEAQSALILFANLFL